jgi:glycosyltransferase involved in cell wall biosynthesis
VRLAIHQARGDILVLMDADGSHQASDIPSLVRPIMDGKADMVIASRLRGGSDEFHGTLDNIIRQAGGAFISLLLHWRWGADITDCENGFRAIDVQKARGLRLQANDFLIEQEMVVKAIKKGLVIREIASHEFARQGGVSKLKTTQGWKFLWHIFREMLF